MDTQRDNRDAEACMEHGVDQGVGARIKGLREEREWSMAKLAVEADMSVSGVSMIENGKRNLTTTTLAKLARAFGVEVRDLFPLGQAPLPLEAFTVGGQPVPTFNLEDLPEEAQAQLAERGYSDAYFVPAEEGEEEDRVELRFYQVRLLGEDAPILQTMRGALPKEAAAPKGLEEASERPVMAAELPGLRTTRVRRGMTFNELVTLSGLTAAEIADLENGEPLDRAIPVAPLAEVLDVSVAELMFPAEQVAAFLAENAADNERIRLEMEKLDANDLRALMFATPALRKLSAAFRKGQEARERERSEAC